MERILEDRLAFEQVRNVKACLQKNVSLEYANLLKFMSMYHFGLQILLHSYSSQKDKQFSKTALPKMMGVSCSSCCLTGFPKLILILMPVACSNWRQS